MHISNDEYANNSTGCQSIVEHNIGVETKARFAINNSNSTNEKLDLAARKIQLFYRKIIAAKAYKHMFDNGKSFRQYQEISSAPKSLADYLQIAQKLSTKAIDEIKTKLGCLTTEEKTFLRKIVQLPNFTLKHQTLYELDHLNSKQESILTLRSHHNLEQHGIKCNNKTSEKDIYLLSNNDFIFFSIDVAGSDLSIKPKSSMTGNNEDYGYKAYMVHPQNKTFGYLTLTDHYYNIIARSSERDDLICDYYKLKNKIYSRYCGNLGTTDTPIFTEQDMRHAVAYYCIYLLRRTNCPKLNKHIYQEASLEDINKFFDLIFTLEFHIPKILSTTNFKLHRLREPYDREIYKLSLFYKNDDIVKQYCLKKYSEMQELHHLGDPKATKILDSIANLLYNYIGLATDDLNADILSFCLELSKKVVDIGSLNFTISLFNLLSIHNQICLNILQHNVEQIFNLDIVNSKFNMNIFYNTLVNILLKSEDFNKEISILLDYCINTEALAKNFEVTNQVDLFILLGRSKDISEELIEKIIPEDLTHAFFYQKLFRIKYQKYHLDYAKIIAKKIIQKSYNLKDMQDGYNLTNKQKDSKILEEGALSMLSNSHLSKQAQAILQHAFITSGLLDPNKKINDHTEITLAEYAKKTYHLSL